MVDLKSGETSYFQDGRIWLCLVDSRSADSVDTMVVRGRIVRRNYWSVGDTYFSQKFAFHLLGVYACTRVLS